jgi:hypothetical protein
MDILAEAKSTTVIFNYFYAFISVAVNLGVALLFVCFSKSKYPKLINKHIRAVYLIVGTSFLLVAGIGKLGWSIQTWDGNAPAESLNEWIFLILSHIGTFLLFIDLVCLCLPQNNLHKIED